MDLSPMPNSIYSAKILQSNKIRLILLLPGNWDDDIHCWLLYGYLSPSLPYKALSYVWGHKKKARSLHINGQLVRVTLNLESALRRLRQELQPIRLWVDALCINQDDDEERALQVQMMGSIYSWASEVIVYLGDGKDRLVSTKSSSSLRRASLLHFEGDIRDERSTNRLVQGSWDSKRLKSTSKDRNMPRGYSPAFNVYCFMSLLAQGGHLTTIPVLSDGRGLPTKHDSYLNFFESLRYFVHSPWTPWWERIWVVQEVVLPQAVKVVYEDFSAPWCMFAHAARSYTQHSHSCCAKLVNGIPRDYTKVLSDVFQRILTIEDMRLNHGTACFRPHSQVASFVYRCTIERQHTSLLTLLRRFRHRRSTDPRDKIYALLSLVHDGPNMVPDYTIDVPDVFRRATLISILETGSLSVLSADLGRKFRQDLPSWVPDWEAPGNQAQITWEDTIGLYNSSTNCEIDLNRIRKSLHMDHKTLKLEGLRIDVVRSVGEVMWDDDIRAFQKTLDSWCSLIYESLDSDVQHLEVQPDVAPPICFPSWSLFCADIAHMPDDHTTWKRTTGVHELWFLNWAFKSSRSPFLLPMRKRLLPRLLTSQNQRAQSLMGKGPFSDTDLGLGPNDWALNSELIPDEHNNAGVMLTVAIEKLIQRMQVDLETRSRSIERLEDDPDVKALVKYTKEYGDVIAEMTHFSGRSVIDEVKAREQYTRWGLLKDTQKQKLRALDAFKARTSGIESSAGFNVDTAVAIIDASIVAATLNRRMFVTREGYMGLGPASMAEGDDVFILKGGHAPFLLRKENDHVTRNPEVVGELIGSCYLHGMMDQGATPPPGRWGRVLLV